MILFRRQRPFASNAVPPEFRWVSVRMEVTTWAITITLSLIGLGVWNGGKKIASLTAAVNSVRLNDTKQDQINEKQDTQIRDLEISMVKQQVYLERILGAVESNGRKISQ